MSAALVVIAVLAGAATVAALSTYGIGFAVLCSPLVASSVTALAAVLIAVRPPPRRGTRVFRRDIAKEEPVL